MSRFTFTLAINQRHAQQNGALCEGIPNTIRYVILAVLSNVSY